jgi:hypothetical protein
MARGLAQAGASIILNGRDEAKLGRAAAALEAEEVRVTTAAFDVTDGAAVTAAVAKLEAEFAPIDILINNAGIQRRAPLAEMTEAAVAGGARYEPDQRVSRRAGGGAADDRAPLGQDHQYLLSDERGVAADDRQLRGGEGRIEDADARDGGRVGEARPAGRTRSRRATS